MRVYDPVYDGNTEKPHYVWITTSTGAINLVFRTDIETSVRFVLSMAHANLDSTDGMCCSESMTQAGIAAAVEVLLGFERGFISPECPQLLKIIERYKHDAVDALNAAMGGRTVGEVTLNGIDLQSDVLKNVVPTYIQRTT